MTPISTYSNDHKTNDVGTQTGPDRLELTVEDLECPITRERDPDVRALACGHIFSEMGARSWISKMKRCPTCNEPASKSYTPEEFSQRLTRLNQVPNRMNEIRKRNLEHLSENLLEKELLETLKHEAEQKENEVQLQLLAEEQPELAPAELAPEENQMFEMAKVMSLMFFIFWGFAAYLNSNMNIGEQV